MNQVDNPERFINLENLLPSISDVIEVPVILSGFVQKVEESLSIKIPLLFLHQANDIFILIKEPDLYAELPDHEIQKLFENEKAYFDTVLFDNQEVCYRSFTLGYGVKMLVKYEKPFPQQDLVLLKFLLKALENQLISADRLQQTEWDNRKVTFENKELIRKLKSFDKEKEQNLFHKERMLLAITRATDELLSNKDLMDAIRQGLTLLGDAVGVDRTYYFENHQDPNTGNWFTSQRFEWNSGAANAQIDNPDLQNVPLSIFGEALDYLPKGDDFKAVISDLSPSDLREILVAQDIKSILIIPIIYRKKFWGFIGYDDCHRERLWAKSELVLLKSFANSVSYAIERAENARSLLNMALFPMQNPDPVVRINHNGDILLKNEAASDMGLIEYDYKIYPEQEFYKFILKNIDISVKDQSYEVRVNDRVLLLMVRSAPNGEYVNIYSNDISKLKETERLLDKLSMVAKSNQSGIIFTDLKGQISWFNERFTEIFQWSGQEIVDKNLVELVTGRGMNVRASSALSAALKRQAEFDLELILRKKNGTEFWTKVKMQPITEGNNSIQQCYWMIEDIHDQKSNAERIRESENRLSTLIANFKSGILLEDDNRKIVVTNNQFCEFFNIQADPNHLIGIDCTNSAKNSKMLFRNPDQFVTRIEEILQAKVLVQNEEIEMIDGRFFERDYIPVYVDDQYKGHLWVYNDVTRRKNYEQNIKDQEEKYRSLIENMNLGILEVDDKETILRAYRWFCDMTGYTEEELIGKDARDLFLPEEYKEYHKKETSIRYKGKSGTYEVQMMRKDGSRIWVLVSGAPVFDNQKTVIGSIGIHYDITSQKLMQQELLKAKKEAETARDAEKQFLSNMSHEIRNPINSIVGMSNLLYDTQLNDTQLNYLNTIKYASEILLNLISDILDINKIDSGHLDYEESEVNLEEVVKGVAKTFSFKSKTVNLEIRSEVDVLTHFVKTDRSILNQILMNLMGNAVKFTESGLVEIKLNVVREADQDYKLKFLVRDTGIGIPKDKLKVILEPFKQVNNDIKLKYGGTGLGLSITNELVKRLGGELEVESEEGIGTIFYFTLSFKKGKPLGFSPNEEASVKKEIVSIRKVLVVEDNKLNQNYLSALLQKFNLEYSIANHGKEALSILEQEIFDLILMDIRMPVMDGYETSIRIRNMKNSNANIPIIALTASALLDEKEKALNAGMNHHLTKPYTEEQLRNAIKDFCQLDSASQLNNSPDLLYQFPAAFDVELLKNYYGNDIAYIGQLFADFCNYVFPEADKLPVLFENQNWEGIHNLVHKIKPNFMMVGFPDLTEKCAKIEEAFEREIRDLFLIVHLYQVFIQEYSKIKPLIAQQNDRLSILLNTK
jgi:PAS domain S-box-containing protein